MWGRGHSEEQAGPPLFAQRKRPVWPLLALLAALVAGAVYLLRSPEKPVTLVVEGKALAVMSSRQAAEDLLDSLRKEAGRLAGQAQFSPEVGIEKGAGGGRAALGPEEAREALAARVRVVVPAWWLKVGGRPVFAMTSKQEIETARREYVEKQLPKQGRLVAPPRFLEKLTVQKELMPAARAEGRVKTLKQAVALLGRPVGRLDEHEVRPGEVAARIARNYGISFADLEAGNPGRDLTRIRPGDKLVIASGKRILSVETVSDETGFEEEPFVREKSYDPKLPAGEERVEEKGRPGRWRLLVRVDRVNGQEKSRRVLSRELERLPVAEKVVVGGKPPRRR
jgi:hypothetical protein